MGYRIAIDASRNRSGGARAHLIGIIENLNPDEFQIEEVHVWSYKALLDQLPNKSWLIKHCPEELNGSVFKQLLWQYKDLPKEVRNEKCEVLLNTTAGSICPFLPAVTMSRDMLSFERKEIGRYGLGRDWLRLYVLRFVQMRSLKRATGALFLTQYAADTIQEWTGKIDQYRVIPHGIGDNFKANKLKNPFPQNGERTINCLYVSNVARYKHQWHVAEAISNLKNKGINISLRMVGGGTGPAQKKLESLLSNLDPNAVFIRQDDFLKHDQIPEAIAEADIFVFASSCENMPNTLVEGMACGIPIACSNMGPMPEVLKDGGQYFDPENAKSIEQAIEKLITESKSREYSAQRSKELSQQYSWQRCSRETMTYLIDIIDASKS